jgi:DNA polymerase
MWVCEGKDGDLKKVCEIMGEPIPWARGLLLPAEGFTSDYYKKE